MKSLMEVIAEEWKVGDVVGLSDGDYELFNRIYVVRDGVLTGIFFAEVDENQVSLNLDRELVTV
jgi:hypothetical protein